LEQFVIGALCFGASCLLPVGTGVQKWVCLEIALEIGLVFSPFARRVFHHIYICSVNKHERWTNNFFEEGTSGLIWLGLHEKAFIELKWDSTSLGLYCFIYMRNKYDDVDDPEDGEAAGDEVPICS